MGTLEIYPHFLQTNHAYKVYETFSNNIKQTVLPLMFGNSIVASDYENQTVEKLRDQIRNNIRKLIKYLERTIVNVLGKEIEEDQ